jgi:hypothetical protein
VGWKNIKGNSYYYHNRRIGRRVVSRYMGHGPVGERAEMVDAAIREARAMLDSTERAEREAEAAELEAEDAEVAGVSAVVDAVVVAALEAAGYHRHKRQWRKRRAPMNEVAEIKPEPYVGHPRKRGKTAAERAEALDALKRASAGDAEAMARVRRLFDEDPERMVYICGVDLWGKAEGLMISALTMDKNPVVKEALERKLDALRVELAGPFPSPLERLAAERVATCWLDVYRQDWRYAAMERDGDVDLGRMDRYDKLRTRAHARYAAALRTLATVRRLDVKIQVAVGQVNVRSGGG